MPPRWRARGRAVVARLRNQPAVTLGLATGATMKPVYARLVTATRADEVSFRAASSFNLDEFVGVAPQLPRSFHAYMQENLFGHVDMDAGRARIPDGMAGDIAAEAARYEALIAASGGIDLLLLGIGANGHIAFNELFRILRHAPMRLGSTKPPASPALVIFLSRAGSRACDHDGDCDNPGRARILLIATGPAKAAAPAAAIEGPIGSACPASALRLHDNVHILCDEAAPQRSPTGLTTTIGERHEPGAARFQHGRSLAVGDRGMAAALTRRHARCRRHAAQRRQRGRRRHRRDRAAGRHRSAHDRHRRRLFAIYAPPRASLSPSTARAEHPQSRAWLVSATGADVDHRRFAARRHRSRCGRRLVQARRRLWLERTGRSWRPQSVLQNGLLSPARAGLGALCRPHERRKAGVPVYLPGGVVPDIGSN